MKFNILVNVNNCKMAQPVQLTRFRVIGSQNKTCIKRTLSVTEPCL